MDLMNNVKIFLLLILIISLLNIPAKATSANDFAHSSRLLFGVIIPLPEESTLFQKKLTQQKVVLIDGLTYHLGTVNHKNIVFINSGVGKVNAAIIATRIIKDFHPDVILMSGSSGSINTRIKKWDIVIGKEVVNVDLGNLTKTGPVYALSDELYNPHTRTALPLTFTLNPKLIQLIDAIHLTHSSNIRYGKIASTDMIPNPPSQYRLLNKAGFDVAEMEGASLMQACWLFQIPCVVIRGASNSMSEPITNSDIEKSANEAAGVLLTIVSRY